MTRPKVKNFTYVSGKKYDGLMGRCYRETDASYEQYGGRGIKVSSNWIKDINNFRAWLTDHLKNNNIEMDEFITNSAEYQLDRIDTNGDYVPENCRIVSCQVNIRNTRKRKKLKVISAEGEEIEI